MGGLGEGEEDIKDNEVAHRDGLRKERSVWQDPKQRDCKNRGSPLAWGLQTHKDSFSESRHTRICTPQRPVLRSQSTQTNV